MERAKFKPGNGDFEGKESRTPPFMALPGGGQRLLVVCLLFDLPLAKFPTRRKVPAEQIGRARHRSRQRSVCDLKRKDK
jgi:hypothetical protein